MSITAKDLDEAIRDMGGWWPETRELILALIHEHDAKVKAAAWDEGHSWGWSDAQEAHDVRQEMERSEWRLSTPNPYRALEGQS